MDEVSEKVLPFPSTHLDIGREGSGGGVTDDSEVSTGDAASPLVVWVVTDYSDCSGEAIRYICQDREAAKRRMFYHLHSSYYANLARQGKPLPEYTIEEGPTGMIWLVTTDKNLVISVFDYEVETLESLNG